MVGQPRVLLLRRRRALGHGAADLVVPGLPLPARVRNHGTDDIQVRVATPGRLSRRCAVGFPCNAGSNGAMYMWTIETRANGSQNDAFLNYSKSLVADVEFGPSPRLP